MTICICEEDDEPHLTTCPQSDTCQWFVRCENKAITTRSHPILGEVPICQACNDKMDRIEKACRL